MGRVDRFVCVGWLVGDLAMTDDIVVQLRWISDTKEWVKLRLWETITTEAADEIERLREELAEAHHAIGVYRKMAGIQPTITKFGDE